MTEIKRPPPPFPPPLLHPPLWRDDDARSSRRDAPSFIIFFFFPKRATPFAASPKGKEEEEEKELYQDETTRASLQYIHRYTLAVLKYFSAGGIGCFASHCLSVPLDVIKTKVQLNPELNSNMSAAELARKNRQDEGAMTLTRGLGATFFGYLIQGGCKYGGFETLKRYYFHGGGNIAQLVLAAMVAESVGSFALVPLKSESEDCGE